MHFSKSYSQILLSLPPGLRENAISYRQACFLRFLTHSCFLTRPPKLKKLINQVVQELTLLGFSPELVRDLLEQGNIALHSMRESQNPDQHSAVTIKSPATTNSGLELLYEVDNDFGHLTPRLRLIIDENVGADTVVSEAYDAMAQL